MERAAIDRIPPARRSRRPKAAQSSLAKRLVALSCLALASPAGVLFGPVADRPLAASAITSAASIGPLAKGCYPSLFDRAHSSWAQRAWISRRSRDEPGDG
jgi:hypothetical protein